MKTKNISLLVLSTLFISVFSFIFSSCDDDKGDNVKPTINLIEPAEGDTLRIGAENGVHFEVEFVDDVMLGSYSVNIHPNFDGHTHSSATLKSTSDEGTVDFNFNKSWSLSGLKNSEVHHHEIIIPANATPGKYHLMVYCVDAAGNEVNIARNIVLSLEGGEDHDHE